MRPGAVVHQVERAAPQWRRLVVLVAMAAVDVVAVLEASVPAVEGSGQGTAFNLNVHPVAVETGGT